jgi:hypothetical protein
VASGQLTTLICALAVNSVGPAFSIGSSIWTLREEERQKLVAQIVKLPNGARFTRLKPVTA